MPSTPSVTEYAEYAEVAELAEDIDLERAQAALSRAQAAGDETEDTSALKRAETRITVAGAAKGLL